MNDKRFSWIDDIDENEIKRILNKTAYLYEYSKKTETKIYYWMQNAYKIADGGKNILSVLKPVFKFALTFSAVLLAAFIMLIAIRSIYFDKTDKLIVKNISGVSYQINEKTMRSIKLKPGDKIGKNMIIVTDKGALVQMELNDARIILSEKTKLKFLNINTGKDFKNALFELNTGRIQMDQNIENEKSSAGITTENAIVTGSANEMIVYLSESKDTDIQSLYGKTGIRLKSSDEVINEIKSLNKNSAEIMNSVLNKETIVQAGGSVMIKNTDVEKFNALSLDIIRNANIQAANNPDFVIDKDSAEQLAVIQEKIIQVNEKTYFNEFFEDFDKIKSGQIPDGFYFDKSDGKISLNISGLNEIKAVSSPYCIKFTDTSLISDILFKKYIVKEDEGQFSFYFNAAITKNSGFVISLKNASEKELIKIAFENNKIYSILNDGSKNELADYANLTWNRFTIKFDNTASYCGAMINEKDLGSFKFISDSNASSISINTYNTVKNNSNASDAELTVYFDDLMYFSTPSKYIKKNQSEKIIIKGEKYYKIRNQNGYVLAEIDNTKILKNGIIAGEYSRNYIKKNNGIVGEYRDGSVFSYIEQKIIADIIGNNVKDGITTKYIFEDNGEIRDVYGKKLFTIDNFDNSEETIWKITAYILFFGDK